MSFDEGVEGEREERESNSRALLNLFPKTDPTPGEGAAVESPMVEARTTRRASLLESIVCEWACGRKVGVERLGTREGEES